MPNNKHELHSTTKTVMSKYSVPFGQYQITLKVDSGIACELHESEIAESLIRDLSIVTVRPQVSMVVLGYSL